MAISVLVLSERIVGEHPEVTYELLGKGREIADQLGGELGIATAESGSSVEGFGAADVVFEVGGLGAGGYAAPSWKAGIAAAIAAASPRVVLMSTGTVGLDLGGSLATRLGGQLASYVVDLEVDGEELVATSQLYGGKMLAEVGMSAAICFATVIPGSFQADAGRKGGSPRVERVDAAAAAADAKATAVEIREPETGGVDIAAAPMLVSVGRGIGSADNLELVQELADALKVPLSASRPVIDSGWLPKPHQVGKSGKKVKPAVYLSFGISGAPEHLEGMRNAEMIIACNTDPGAPIFEVAHYGTTVDLFDLVPELTERLGG